MKRRRKLFSKKTRPREEVALQITSMADVFTIILVFLLKSFSTDISGITPNVTLPEARGGDEVTDVLKVEIAENTILLDSKPVTHLSAYQFDTNDLESNQTPRSLNEALIVQRQKEQARTPASVTGETKTPKLMVLADEKTPYSTLRIVLTSAANQGFSDFKLLVVEDQ